MPLASEESRVHIRPATIGDGARLAEIDRLTRSADVTPAPPAGPDDFLDIDRVRDTLVAHDGDDVIGYVVVQRSRLCPVDAHIYLINGLAVDPAHQGRRIGRELVIAAERVARRRGGRRITLRVLGVNANARALYTSCGYRIEGVLEGEFLVDGRYVDDVLMALDLTDAA